MTMEVSIALIDELFLLVLSLTGQYPMVMHIWWIISHSMLAKL